MTTLFAQRIDLSDSRRDGTLLLRRNPRFDTYAVGFSGVTIQHSAKRGNPELIASDPERGNTYVAGEATDVFAVWVRQQDAIPGGRPGITAQIAEVATFDEAVAVAHKHLGVTIG
jgi:hypothetical protein